jgi:hypothetical protein
MSNRTHRFHVENTPAVELDRIEAQLAAAVERARIRHLLEPGHVACPGYDDLVREGRLAG